MNETSELAHKSNGATPLVKLCRMLRSTLRRYPQARVWVTRDGFGVSLAEGTFVRVSYSGHWTDADMRDLHALFATWYVADGAFLTGMGRPLVGVLQAVERECAQSSTRQV